MSDRVYFGFDPAEVCSPEWLSGEIYDFDTERDAMLAWQQCGECHEPERAMDMTAGLCWACWRNLRSEL